jgi:hypothetical protein
MSQVPQKFLFESVELNGLKLPRFLSTNEMSLGENKIMSYFRDVRDSFFNKRDQFNLNGMYELS